MHNMRRKEGLLGKIGVGTYHLYVRNLFRTLIKICNMLGGVLCHVEQNMTSVDVRPCVGGCGESLALHCGIVTKQEDSDHAKAKLSIDSVAYRASAITLAVRLKSPSQCLMVRVGICHTLDTDDCKT